MSEYADPGPDRRAGGVDVLRDRVTRLDDEIDRLANQLAPVLNHEGPEKADTQLETIASSMLEECSNRVDGAATRLMDLRSRLAV